MKPVCVVSCPIDTYSGYGARSRDFVKSLIEVKGQEWDIQILAQRWGETPTGYLQKNNGEDMLGRCVTQLNKQPDVWIQITVPNEFQKVGKHNIGVTAGIESTQPPGEWIEGVNRMDLVLMSSKFSKDVFEKAQYDKKDPRTGATHKLVVTTPIDVLMEGIDLDTYFKAPEKSGLLDGIEESFCYLFTGHWLQGGFTHDRKNVGGLVHAFFDAFKNKPRGKRPALLLKTSCGSNSLMDRQQVENKINDVRDMFKGHKLPNVYLLHGEFTNEELNAINNDPKVKAFVSLTRGEGFGRPLAEQAITGKPVITTNWSGHTDFLNPQYNVLLGGRLINIHPSAANNMLLKEAQWFDVNPKQVNKALKDVYKNYKNFATQSRPQTNYLKNNFAMSNMNQQLAASLEKINVVTFMPLELPTLNSL